MCPWIKNTPCHANLAQPFLAPVSAGVTMPVWRKLLETSSLLGCCALEIEFHPGQVSLSDILVELGRPVLSNFELKSPTFQGAKSVKATGPSTVEKCKLGSQTDTNNVFCPSFGGPS